METTAKQKVSFQELGDFYKRLTIMVTETIVCTQVCMIGLEILSEVEKNKTRERVKGHYRLIGNKLRWINGYWREKRTLQERH